MRWRLLCYAVVWLALGVTLVRSWRARDSHHVDEPVAIHLANDRAAPLPRARERDERPVLWRITPHPGSRHLNRSGEGGALVDPNDVASRLDPDRLVGEYVIRFKHAAERDRFRRMAEAEGASIMGDIPGLNILRVRARDAAHWQRLLAASPSTIVHTPNHIIRMPEPHLPPEPPADIAAYRPFLADAAVWLGLESSALPGRPVTVALLDDGISSHWALAGVSWHAADLLEAGTPDDGGWHGSAMASLIAGTSEAVPGLAVGAGLRVYRVLDQTGKGNAFTLAEAIVRAVDEGADVINCSLGTYGDNLALKEAVAYAYSRGVPVIAAVGNDGADGQVMYPAAYPSAIAVAAVDANGRHTWFSNRGDAVDVAAPGYQLNAAWENGGIGRISGTSPATALVSAAVARLLSEEADLSPDDVRDILRANSDDFGAPGTDPSLGAGIMNLERIARRHQPGIFEMSVRPPHVLIDPSTPDRYTGVFFAQNSGTERLDHVGMTVVVGHQSNHATFHHVEPGENAMITLDLGPVDGDPRELEIWVEAVIRDAPVPTPIGRLSGILHLD